ncbi:F0F1 ATP synthase subunit delta [Pseudorhodoferax sp.]|uniref:F0F1 ATP synthase subunit delta n=1 Tax=Pseudorhodoferax sp. TaxID=1993553 RepID=UPI0039E52D63
MAELATIARPYAEALFKAGASDLEGTQNWLDQLTAVVADPQVIDLAANPKVTPGQVFDLIAGATPTVLPEMGKNFLRVLIDNGRLQALPEAAAQFRLLKNAVSGAADAVVYSAFPIDGATLQDVTSMLEQRFGRRLTTRVEVDPSLIGGIRAVVGDEVLDTSVKARLEQMKAALTA